MKDADVIKALSTISYGGWSCMSCKYGVASGPDRCGLKGCYIARLAIDLVNRQQSEIEKLKSGFVEEYNAFLEMFGIEDDYEAFLEMFRTRDEKENE